MDYDFSGWVTKNDILCSDGRTIRQDAFAHQDGDTVPLVWNHNHAVPTNILGNVRLENRPEGVFGYGKFNDTETGQNAKSFVQHGDIVSLSICANKLKQTKNRNVLKGQIKEVSLVIGGANQGAKIENVIMHEDESSESMIYYVDEEVCSFLVHAEPEEKEPEKEPQSKTKEEEQKVDEKKKTVQDVLDGMTEEQQNAVGYVVAEFAKKAGVTIDEEGNIVKHSDEEEGEEVMKHNVFNDEEMNQDNVLTHDDQVAIIALAKKSGKLSDALEIYASENNLQHADVVGGFVQTGDGNVTTLFPEYKDVRPGAPELVTNDQGWISLVLNKVHKSPISRIRTQQVDIRKIDALRAKGYDKGKKKKLAGNFNLVRRTTDPQTVYVKNALHRDDVVDITDFDYAVYLYGIDKMMLNEELAMAIMLGDGRDEGDEDKIQPDHIRPIWLDDELYTLHVDLDIEKAKTELQGTNTEANFGENYITAEAMVNTVLYAREKYKGTGTPDLYCTPRMLNVMLLARDLNGRRVYSTVQELQSALNVGKIVTAEQFAGKIRTDDKSQKKELVGIICNLADYSLGATKGGELTHFTDFDIDFNLLKSLLETRTSGALTRIQSAIAIEKPVANPEG